MGHFIPLGLGIVVIVHFYLGLYAVVFKSTFRSVMCYKVILYHPGCPRRIMVKAIGGGIVVIERYYVHFQTNALGKGLNHLILPAIGLIVPQLFF